MHLSFLHMEHRKGDEARHSLHLREGFAQSSEWKQCSDLIFIQDEHLRPAKRRRRRTQQVMAHTHTRERHRRKKNAHNQASTGLHTKTQRRLYASRTSIWCSRRLECMTQQDEDKVNLTKQKTLAASLVSIKGHMRYTLKLALCEGTITKLKQFSIGRPSRLQE